MSGNFNGPDLGFVFEVEDERLLSACFFPSKLGGKPAWLDPRAAPSAKDLTCRNCDRIMRFILQMYAPVDLRPSSFHRTLFLFACSSPQCCRLNCESDSNFAAAIVIRQQLPRVNGLWPESPPDYDNPAAADGVTSPDPELHMCAVCGIRAPHVCGQCKKVYYCSREHQKEHWEGLNGHKERCGQQSEEEAAKCTLHTYRQFGLEMEAEEECLPEGTTLESILKKDFENDSDDEDDNEDGVTDEAEGQRIIDEWLAKHKKKSRDDKSFAEEFADETKDAKDSTLIEKDGPEKDPTFINFCNRTNIAPDQIIRYQRGAEPLWLNRDTAMKDDAPPCEKCGKRRIFECSVLPQALHFLCKGIERSQLSAIDWGQLTIYTCEDSCGEASDCETLTEFVHRQFPSGMGNYWKPPGQQ
eukprot:Clim_evm18s206 gene=Clim_evmTU18s206